MGLDAVEYLKRYKLPLYCSNTIGFGCYARQQNVEYNWKYGREADKEVIDKVKTGIDSRTLRCQQ